MILWAWIQKWLELGIGIAKKKLCQLLGCDVQADPGTVTITFGNPKPK